MSVKIMSLAWESTIRDRTQVDVLVYLANCSDDWGGNCFPGIPRIARMTRCSERTVIRAIAALEKDGWISVVRGDGAGNTSQYQINLAKLKGCQDDTLSEARKRVTPGQKRVTTTTKKGDIDDNPPHPLFGVSVSDPSVEPTPPYPPRKRVGDSPETCDASETKACAPPVAEHALSAGKGECAPAPPGDSGDLAADSAAEVAPPEVEGRLTAGFDPGQLAHLATCEPAKREAWERFYREENASRSVETRSDLEQLDRAKAEFTDVETATRRVMDLCGFIAGERGSIPLERVIAKILGRGLQLGAATWTTGPLLVKAWNGYRGGAYRYGPLKFFRDGHWREYVAQAA